MNIQDKIRFAREEAARATGEYTRGDGATEDGYFLKIFKMFPRMFEGEATDKDALDFFGWLEHEYADCF